MRILFTPLGFTDPIRFFRDGSALNVARHYQPDIVYLYMSGEIVNNHRKDNRYVYSFKKLAEHLGKTMDIRVIERPDLKNVHVFDNYFLTEFHDILDSIHCEYPDAEIILNVSSGSPAMKYELQILSMKLNYNCIAVQVSTPQEKSNPKVDNESDLTPEEHWELNESNEIDDNRCVVSETANLLNEFRRQTVVDMVKSYNYPAAYQIAKTSPAFTVKCVEMLDAACSRLKLKYSKTRTIFGKYGVNIINAPKECADLYEYLLVLRVKLCNEDYADFLRAITPAIANLFEMYLERKCGISLGDHTSQDRKGRRVWDRQKMENTETGAKILTYMDTRFNNGLTDGKDVSSQSLVYLIEEYSPDSNVISCAAMLRNVEENLRNKAAHAIIAISEKTVYDKTGYKPDEIFQKMVKMFGYCGYSLALNSYDQMNNVIVESAN